MSIPDIQCSKPEHKIALKTVGINNFKLPIILKTKEGLVQYSIATIDTFIDLNNESKGINMSRLPIGIQLYKNKIFDYETAINIADYIRQKSNALRCQIIYNFPYFIEKAAPISKEIGITYNDIKINIIKYKNNYDFILSITTWATSLCPCSKEISEHQGAHNQRSKITITVKMKKNTFVWFEDLIDIANISSSCEIYSVLKRVDEKEVTINAYKNPKFVEDIARHAYTLLDNNLSFEWFEVEVINEESIHQHNAYCKVNNMENTG